MGNRGKGKYINEFDSFFYEERLKDFLPDKIIDIHTHIWLDSMINQKTKDSLKSVSWPSLVAKDNSIEDLLTSYSDFFPDKKVTPFLFSQVNDKESLDVTNNYTAVCAKKYGFSALAVTRPDWSMEKFYNAIKNNNFIGSKVYLNFADNSIPAEEIRIFDFLPHHQLEVLDKQKWIVMLHIPRAKRLKDSLNIAQILEIERKYPNLKLIIAHVGRAYCLEDIGNAFDILKETKNLMFDISANTNAEVFEKLIKSFGTKRILFGSDLPIAQMRMKRVCEKGNYVNIVPKNLYGDISNDIHMRNASPNESKTITLFIYEIIDAFRKAAKKMKLSHTDIEDVFYNNAFNLIEGVKCKGQN